MKDSKDVTKDNTGFTDLLKDIVTPREDAADDYTFNISGMTVTSVTNDPRVKDTNTDE